MSTSYSGTTLIALLPRASTVSLRTPLATMQDLAVTVDPDLAQMLTHFQTPNVPELFPTAGLLVNLIPIVPTLDFVALMVVLTLVSMDRNVRFNL